MKKLVIGLKLFGIAALSGALLYFVNGFTKPIIEEVQEQRAIEMYSNIFNDLDTFEVVTVDDTVIDYSVLIKDSSNNEVGTIYSASMNNDYGSITVLVGISIDGEIVGYEYSFMNQTPTYAAKILTDEFKANFISRTTSDSYDDVDVKVGATYSATTTKELIKAVVKYHKGVN